MANPVQLRQQADYRFAVQFGASAPELLADEPPPLGQGAGPSPVQLLAAAIGNCLADSLVFALRKFKQSAEPVRATAEAVVGRNEHNRLRVQRVDVRLTLGAPASALQHLDRALEQFEDFCTVTQSVRPAFPVVAEVYDSGGQRLK
ncbi:MAG TPA: OsmC family protein [Burkholderiales bacterium]